MTTQLLLFRDPCPLVERLGREFFLRLPERPGVYLMRGAGDELLYVGKAKNLRQRLAHYRVANPDRMPRRHLRLLRAVRKIEVQECDDERAALEHEARLLRTLKPRFNRAGTWPGPPRFLAWRICRNTNTLQLTVSETPENEWRAHGPMGSAAHHLRAALVRVLWMALCPEDGLSRMPAGWFRGQCGEVAALPIPAISLETRLEELFAGKVDNFVDWIASRVGPELPLFDQTVLHEDLEFVTDRLSLEARGAVNAP